MIKKLYQAKVCDICGSTLAVKRKLFYEGKSTYITMRKDGYKGREKMHLCYLCWDLLRYKTKEALAERARGNE